MSGYSEGGASLIKKTLKSWVPLHLSAKSDIDANLHTLRNRAADLAINSAIGRAAIKTQITGVINEGLNVYPKLNHEALGLSAEEARSWASAVKSEFEFWSESTECDWYRRNTFKELQRIAFEESLVDGDDFCLFRRGLPRSTPYSLRLQLIEAQRVSNPQIGNFHLVEMPGPTKNSRIVNGIETDARGILKAIWVSNKIWNEISQVENVTTWQRVKCYGASGGRNVLHICNDSRIRQNRGEPYLSPVIEVIKNVDRYSEAELTSAIIKSFFSLFFVELTSESSNYDLNEVLPDEEFDLSEYKLGSGTLNKLPKGVDVKAVGSSNAQSTFETFINAYSKQVGAALGLPIEVLLKSFNSSYSASKAALLQAENEFRQRKKSFIVDFCQPVYETFLAEAVALGRVNAPGYFEDAKLRHLWNQADWFNETNHLLDPQRELQASKLKLELGLSTYEKEAAELCGTDYYENLKALEMERKLRDEKILERERTDQ